MSADDIINTAFRKNFIIPGEGLFILEGHPGRDELRIVPADRAFIDNLNCFVYNINHGFVYLGIYTTETRAKEAIELIREKFEKNDIVTGKNLFILEAHPEKNLLRIVPADSAFIENLNCFEDNINHGFVYVGAYTTEEKAGAIIELIRKELKNEQGRIQK